MPELGRLEKVDLRSGWMSEAGDFTPWLAQSQNIKLLSETIDIDLELEARETSVGPFRADLLCREIASDDHFVLIENQLEKTDHNHLGQIITYAAGLKAVTIVWIAERFTEEHRAALDWLNEITDERFAFFGLELELWRIGSSPFAPKFNIVSKPNKWARQVQDAAKQSIVSDHRHQQLQFWIAFKKYMEEQQSFVKCQKPLPQNWMSHALGRSGFKLGSVVSSWNSETNAREPEIRAELILEDNLHAKFHFQALLDQKTEIEAAMSQPLFWHNPENRKSARIYVRRNANFLDLELWPEQHAWLKTNLEKLHQTFAAKCKNL